MSEHVQAVSRPRWCDRAKRQSDRSALELVSHSSCPDAVLGNDYSAFPSLSEDGRFVTFFSAANNLVPNDSGASEDVFVFDRSARAVKRVSNGVGASRAPRISKTGRFIAFYSTSPSLVEDDTNGKGDVFVYDALTHELERVSVSDTKAQGDGHATASVDDPTLRPDISSDGRFVLFVSQAKNLVPGDTNNKDDVFLRDRKTKTTRRISVSTRGAQANAHSTFAQMSDDGRVVVFASAATNLIDGERESTNYVDIFVHRDGRTERLSQNESGQLGDADSSRPTISADGKTVAFSSAAANLASFDNNQLTDVFVCDVDSRRVDLVSRAADGTPSNGFSSGAALSADGQRIVFDSLATTLAAGASGKIATYVVDRRTKAVRHVSGENSDASTSYRPSISADGRLVAFETRASTLVPGDRNGESDIFVHLLPD